MVNAQWHKSHILIFTYYLGTNEQFSVVVCARERVSMCCYAYITQLSVHIVVVLRSVRYTSPAALMVNFIYYYRLHLLLRIFSFFCKQLTEDK